MNPTAIYSKSGKGVQEAAGKTSLLKRGDRVVLSAIDGRATLADVAQKVGKTFDPGFEQLIAQLDKDGFIREVSSGTAPAAKPGARPAAKPTAPMDAASDLDFSSFAPAPKPASPPPRPASPPPSPKPAAPPPRAAPAAAAPAKEQQSALNQAREEAEAKAAAEREKQKAEAEAKVRAEMEAKMRAEAEEKAKDAAANKGKADAAARLQAEADAKIKAARDTAVRAAAEAKAKADAEAKRVREEAERHRRETEAKAEQARKQLEEERRKLEEERKRHEEEARKKEEERAERRRREEEEEQARRKQREEEEQKAEEEREARRKQREEEDRREEEERAARKQEQEERRRREEAEEAEEQAKAAQRKPKAEAKPAASGAGFSDSLLSDLESFGKKDDEERKEKEEAERKAKAEEAKRRAREEEERREREEEEEKERKRRAKEEAKRKEKEEEEAREREEEEAKERKRKEKEEAKRKEEEEAKHKEEEEKKRKKAKKKDDDDIPISDADLSDGDVKRDQRELAKAAKAAPRPKESARVKLPPPVTGPSVRRRPTKWGKPVAIVLFLLLAGGLGVAHVMPIDTGGYERAASEALGQPVKIGSGRLWLFSGSLQLRLQGVTVGDGMKIASVHAFPSVGSLSEQKKAFSRIDLEGLSLPQAAAGGALFARAKADNFSVERIVVKQLELTGPLVFPKNIEADIALDTDGALRAVTVRGADGLVAKLAPRDSAIDVEVTAGGFALPIAPDVAFSSFGLKGSATRQGMRVEKWDGTLLGGSITGTANVRWGATWSVDGVFTMRGINAAVFAPALLSEGRGEGTAKFQLSGTNPAKLGASGRFEGNFTVNSGVLGSFDLNQALATGGKRASGRTPFTEMTGQAVYQAGTVALRNVTITAGSAGNMNAGASVDVAPSGALSGRIVADVRTPNQMLRATLNLGGTVKDPQVRN